MLSADPSAIPTGPISALSHPSGKSRWSKLHMQETERIMRSAILYYRGSSYLAIVLLVHISTSVLELWLNVNLERELTAYVF